MPTAPYKKRSGESIPSVTQCLSVIDKPALIWWAWKQGLEQSEAFIYEDLFRTLGVAAHVDVDSLPPGIADVVFRIRASAERTGHRYKEPALYEKRDQAADAGTLAHDLVEADIKGVVLEREAHPAVRALAERAFENYKLWAEVVHLDILETELHLVHEQLEFGGTPDAVGSVNGQVCLLDWKTSKGVYTEHKLQVAAYTKLLEANDIEVPGGAHLVRFDKEGGEFAHYHLSEQALEPCWRAFRFARELYSLLRALK